MSKGGATAGGWVGGSPIYIVDWAEEMDRIRAVLHLEFGDFPHYLKLYKSFERTPMSVWSELLSGTNNLLEQSGHAAIDATGRFYTPEFTRVSSDRGEVPE